VFTDDIKFESSDEERSASKSKNEHKKLIEEKNEEITQLRQQVLF
jgi:hypothetical protein